MVLNLGYTYPLEARSTETGGMKHQNFRDACPEKCFKCVVDSGECSRLNFIRGQALSHRLFRVFLWRSLSSTQCYSSPYKVRWLPVVERLFMFLSCAKKLSSFWDTEVVAQQDTLKMRSSFCPWPRLPCRYIQPPQRLEHLLYREEQCTWSQLEKRYLSSLISFQAVIRVERIVIFCDPDPIRYFQNSVQVQP